MIMLLPRHIGEVEIENATYRGDPPEVSPGKRELVSPAGGDGRAWVQGRPRPGGAGARGP